MNRISEHSILESVITYSIDNSDHENNEILKSLGLNSNTFYNTPLYKRRPKKEQEIKDAIFSPSGAVKIKGKPGTGKTTVTTKVLRELGVEYLTKKFDIKSDKKIENSNYRDKHKLSEHLDSVLLGYLKKELIRQNINRDEVLAYFLNASDLVLEHIEDNVEFTDFEAELKSQFDRHGNSEELSKWISKFEYGTPLNQLVTNLYSSLKPENLAYFLVNGVSRYKSIIFFWDNVDSIIDDQIRTAFFRIIDKYQSGKSDCISIIVSFRSNNPSLIQMRDVGSFNAKSISMDVVEEDMSDKDDVQWKKKPSHPDEEEEEEEEIERYLLRNEFNGQESTKNYSLRKAISKRNEEFSMQLLHRRIRFLFENIDKISHLVDSQKLDSIRKLIFAFKEDKHFRTTTSAICNYDRREVLKLISNFIRFISESQYTRYIQSIKGNREKMTVYESYFYYWLATGTDVFSNNINDSLSECIRWKQKGDGHSGCTTDLQILNFIYNLTLPPINDIEESRKLEIGELVKEFRNIGLKREEVVNRVFKMYKDGSQHLGFIEMSRYFDIDSASDIQNSDKVWLLPRGINYILYTNVKYTYLFSVLVADRPLNATRSPLTIDSFKLVFSFLFDLGSMYAYGLFKLKKEISDNFPSRSETKDFWIEYYSRTFCVEIPSRSSLLNSTKYSYLHFYNIVGSHIKYLDLIAKRDLDLISNVDVTIPFKNYHILLGNFENIVDDISENRFSHETVSSDLKRGIVW